MSISTALTDRLAFSRDFDKTHLGLRDPCGNIGHS
jgi:hypothetical protein